MKGCVCVCVWCNNLKYNADLCIERKLFLLESYQWKWNVFLWSFLFPMCSDILFFFCTIKSKSAHKWLSTWFSHCDEPFTCSSYMFGSGHFFTQLHGIFFILCWIIEIIAMFYMFSLTASMRIKTSYLHETHEMCAEPTILSHLFNLKYMLFVVVWH